MIVFAAFLDSVLVLLILSPDLSKNQLEWCPPLGKYFVYVKVFPKSMKQECKYHGFPSVDINYSGKTDAK